MKKLALLLGCFMCVVMIKAQSAAQIKDDPRYVWGEGTGSSLRNADREALEQIAEQISLVIVNKGRHVIKNEQKGHDVQTEIVFEKVMNTYSTATVNNTHRVVVENGPVNYRVFRYVAQSDIDKIFESRIEKIGEFVKIANRSLEQTQINDALRYYFWANVLTQSLRYPNDAKVRDESNAEQMAAVWIPKRINEIFSGIKTDVLNANENIFEIGFFYNGKPVSTLDFTYFDGKDWSCINTATDGKGVIEFHPGSVPANFQVRYEYEYFNEAHSDREVKTVLDAMVSSVSFPRAQVNVNAGTQISKTSAEFTNLQTLETKAPDLESTAQTSVAKTCDAAMQKVMAAIRNKNYDSVKSLFTEDGYDVFDRLIKYGKGYIVGEPKLSYSTLYGDTYCRSVPMNFVFSRNRKFVEDVVFVFNPEGLIYNVSFSLGKVGTNDIINDAQGWTMEAKNVLINFLETYKTAYALGRADYLDKIFADDALIIKGKVLTKSTRKFDDIYTNNRIIQLNKVTKDEYIKNLRRIFATREYVNIKFANNMIKKTGKGSEVYAIQIKQDFYSSSYGDSGYLFILVDLNVPNEPVIRVRAWQEELDKTWGKYGPEIF